MGRDVPGRERTLIEQAFRLRQDFPGGKVKLRPTLLVWTSRLTPTPLSREYTVRILYVRGHYPRVMLVEPRLESEERQLLHHLYPNGDLCLHQPDEWNPSMLLVETTVRGRPSGSRTTSCGSVRISGTGTAMARRVRRRQPLPRRSARRWPAAPSGVGRPAMRLAVLVGKVAEQAVTSRARCPILGAEREREPSPRCGQLRSTAAFLCR